MSPMYGSWYTGPAGTGIFWELDSPSSNSRGGGGIASSTNEWTFCFGVMGNGSPCGWQAAYWNPSRKIDYIFASNLDFSNRSADATYALHSDHTPLWGSLTLN